MTHIKSAKGADCMWGTRQYSYDAEGKRVHRVSSTFTGAYVYDNLGRHFADMTPQGNVVLGEIYAGARHIATYNIGNGATYFIHTDWLGTERARSLYNGTLYESCTGNPFGDGQNCTGTDVSQMHFTGKERDQESGNDYFGARYYASNMGRFLSPDWSAKAEPVPYAKLENPQTLNLYGYMQNNPLGGVDQDGHCDWCQKLWNGITGNGWQTNAQLAAQQQQATVTTTETYSLPANQASESTAEPNEAVALGADTVGLASATPGVVPEIAGAIPGAPAFGLGLLATGVSVNNDPSALNLSINATSTTLGAMSTFGTGAVATAGTVGGFGVAVGALAWDGSNFVSNNVITPVFTPDANQSDTINANGVTIPAPNAYDSHQQQ